MSNAYGPQQPKRRTPPRTYRRRGTPVVLPRRSAPVVLGLAVTSLVTMLLAGQLVIETTSLSFDSTRDSTRPVELTLGSLGPVEADAPAGAATRTAPGPPGRSRAAGGTAGAGSAAPPATGGRARRLPPPPRGFDATPNVVAVVDRHADRAGKRVARAPEPPKDRIPIVIGHRGLPCSERRRWTGRPPGSCPRPKPSPGPPSRRRCPPAPSPSPEPPLLALLPHGPPAMATAGSEPPRPVGPRRPPSRSSSAGAAVRRCRRIRVR